MSTDSHDQSESCVSKSTARLLHDESAFDGRRIKKERTDVSLENGRDGCAGVVAVNAPQENQPLQPQSTQRTAVPAAATAPARITNGFHDGADLLQDIIAALANNGSATKHEKIRLMIEDSISDESKSRIQEIFTQIEQLKIEEKLLLYLKLPLALTNSGGTVDPLRQPLNPLGNRYEIHQTIMWIKTHLEEDPDVSLPKQEVYDEYNMYCIRNSMKPLSTADFGKVMKQVYPRVRPRRLGTRGNSRYCYAGMRKRVKLEPPTLPTISDAQNEDVTEENITEEMLGAASTLIREWAESLLGLKFPTLSALARHLVDHLCVDSRSLAAVCILCASSDTSTSTNKEATTGPPITPLVGKSGKLREAQLQLQRKLQQREHIRDQKHRHLDTVTQNQNKEKTVDSKAGGNKGSKRVKANQSPQGTNTLAGQNALTKLTLSAVVTGRQRKVQKPVSQACNNVSPESICDNIVVQSIDDIQSNSEPRVVPANCVGSQKEVKPKNTRKRANTSLPAQPSESSPEKQTKVADQQAHAPADHSTALLPRLSSIQRAGKISVILASNLKPTKCKPTGAANDQPAKNCDNEAPACPENGAKTNGCLTSLERNNTTGPDGTNLLTKDQLRLLQETSNFTSKNDKLCTIDPDALDDYLNGGNNSQEQEEELVQYFQQSSSSSSDVEAGAISTEGEVSRSDQVSQLRLILQQNLKAGTVPPVDLVPAAIIRQNVTIEKRDAAQKHSLILPTLLNHPNQANTRRRVSFETNVVEHAQDPGNVANTVPQSPNTRRRIFNFTPISPGPHSPINGRASKSNSANASPFVSPRNTPVPRSRSNLQGSSSRSRAAQKTLSRSISCNVPYSGKSETFVVPTSGPELVRQISMPRSPLTCTKSSEVQVGNSVTQVTVATKQENQGSQCPSFLSSDLTPQKQLLINYPSQENLQEIKNVYQKSQPTDQEISELFHSNKQFTNEQQLFYRSQSVPLHRMVNPALMSPISAQQLLPTFQSQSFNPSTNSSIAPTPVPSEFNDFGSMGQSEGNSAYLLDDVDPNFMSEDQQFLMSDKEITSENITNILNILSEEDQQNLEMLPEQPVEITMDALPSGNLSLPEANLLDPSAVLDTSVSGALQKIIQSRSYPNTPLPLPVSTYAPSYAEDSNGSKSYPSTPMHAVQSQEVYQETNEPMLSSPTLNSLNLHNDATTGNSAGNLCRNVPDLLETNFLADADGDTDDLDSLGNFDGLQDVSLTPLFNEVAEPNR